MQTYSLLEINSFLRQVVALNLPDAVWVQCEIAQCNTSRGHYFLALIQKSEDSDEIVAQASGVLWGRQYRKLLRKLGSTLREVIQEGRTVQLQCRFEFSERYGLNLNIEDVDPAYTLGQLALQRNKIIGRLQTEGLLGKNKSIHLAQVIQRIAVISSEKAAGYQDFIRQLDQNRYGYRFAATFFPSAMQGKMVEEELSHQLDQIQRQSHRFDVIVITRGGGARLDLTAFDNYHLGKRIAESVLPVLIGIGHDIDETVLDLVAHSSLKTPTAVADFIINHNEHFEIRLMDAAFHLRQLAGHELKRQEMYCESLTNRLEVVSRRRLQEQQSKLGQMAGALPLLSRFQVERSSQSLEQLEKLVCLLQEEATLNRGFVRVYSEQQQLLHSAATAQKAGRLQLQFKDGRVNATVESKQEPHG